MTWKKRYPRKFVIRTIRNGQVKINGKIYRPDGPDVHEDEIAYDGRLDGQRWAFGLYWYGPNLDELQDLVNLWGTEAMYKAADETTFHDEYEKLPNCWLDETTGQWPYHWDFWYTDGERAKRAAIKGANDG